MSDLSKCCGRGCLKKAHCRRFTDEEEGQDYAPFFHDALTCMFFVPNGDEAKQIPLPLKEEET